jgi:hypothetical protein
MAMLRCDVTEGPREGFKTVAVPSMEGHPEFLAIEEKFLTKQGDQFFLHVRVIGEDRKSKATLVQLPVEADSGANRVWIHPDNLVEAREVLT